MIIIIGKRLYSIVPKFANLRCGLWYNRHFDSSCYFKSTDGHTYHWQFSLSRLNLHVLKTALNNDCIMIVDSTRKGKLFPDSMSKTIPMWCCVMNRVLQHLKFGKANADLKLPTWVHDTEKIQIEESIPGWVELVLKSGVNFSEFIAKFSKPLQCAWISRRTDLDNFISFSTEGLDFIPVILVSASDPDHPLKNASWEYIQGSGDDHETWALSLTPQIFWENKDKILARDVQSGEDCERVVKQILESYRKTTSLSDMQHIYDSSSISQLHINNKDVTENGEVSATQIGICAIFIGSFSNCKLRF